MADKEVKDEKVSSAVKKQRVDVERLSESFNMTLYDVSKIKIVEAGSVKENLEVFRSHFYSWS